MCVGRAQAFLEHQPGEVREKLSSDHRVLNICRAHRNNAEWKLMLKLDRPVTSILKVQKRKHRYIKEREKKRSLNILPGGSPRSTMA